MKTKEKSVWKTVLIVLAVIAVFCGAAGIFGYTRSLSNRKGHYVASEETRIIEGTEGDGIGTVEISTLPLDLEPGVRRACYSFSGRVLLGYIDGSDTVISSVNDDGTGLVELYRGKVSSGNRLLPFADNTRILLGNVILECPEGTDLDTCPEHQAVPVPIQFPSEFSEDPEVTDTWTEVIIAQDCEHFAWTIRRSDCGAVNAMGRLVRTEDCYVIEDAAYISNMTPFSDDPENEGCSIYTPVIGGEVKQFVRGGTAISLVGSDLSGMADSVVQDVATGEVTQLTHTPGYDETTMLSPDETLGITMTSRFSETTDLGVLGLVPRPFGQPLHNILGQVYMYCVTGVRSGREGNIGPALINLSLSMSDPEYTGIDLSDPEEKWVYLSPMSWKDDGTRAMWIERQREGGGFRVQIVTLLDYEPGEAVETAATPEPGDYASEPAENPDYDTTVMGRVSGLAHLTKKSGRFGSAEVTVTYDNFSDDGVYFCSGTETSSGSAMSPTVYSSDLKVTDADGNECGGMDVSLRFGAAASLPNLISGNTSPHLDTAVSEGTAVWEGRTADISSLVE